MMVNRKAILNRHGYGNKSFGRKNKMEFVREVGGGWRKEIKGPF